MANMCKQAHNILCSASNNSNIDQKLSGKEKRARKRGEQVII